MAPAPSGILHETVLPLEAAVFSPLDAAKAYTHGAKRIELNAAGSYDQGGLTPNAEDVKALVPTMKIPVRIMIRPRGAPANGPDFIYSDEEFDTMLQNIADFKATGVLNPLRGDGFVFGILTKDAYGDFCPIDVGRCKKLVTAARPFGCAFHRAFDPIAASPQWKRGIDMLVACGFESVLTSGGPGKYSDNISRLLDLARYAVPHSLEIVAGGGVRTEGVASPAKQLAQLRRHNVWLHSACIVKNDSSPTGELDVQEFMELVGTLRRVAPD